jgi:rubredoxin
MAPRTTVVALLALCCLHAVSAFIPRALPVVPGQKAVGGVASRPRAASISMMSKQYWEGEWVCADCGYIYDRDDCGGLPFEEQKFGFKCPQCSAPRRRFAKKVRPCARCHVSCGARSLCTCCRPLHAGITSKNACDAPFSSGKRV